MVLPYVQLVVPPPGETGLAALTVVLVLMEAIVLYVAYGKLTRIASPLVRKILESI